MLGIIAGLLLSAQAQEPLMLPEPPPRSTVRLVYTGFQRGVGQGNYPFLGLQQLPAGTLESVVDYNGLLAQGPWSLWSASGRVQAVLDVVSAGDITCSEPVRVAMVKSSSEISVLDEGFPDEIRSEMLGTVGTAALRTCTSAGGEALLLGPSVGAPSWVLSDFEFRRLLRVSVTGGKLWMLGRPTNEAARVFAQIEQLRSEPGTLFVDAGSFVDGASAVRSGHLSLHRELVFDTLAGLQPTVLVPGETELIAGPENFFGEASRRGLSYVATNWASEDPAFALPPHEIVSVQTPHGELQVALLGMLDPELHTHIPELSKQGVKITPPVAAVQAAADALLASERPPNAIIVLTTASSEVMEEARRRLHGVDLMMGDRSFATERVERDSVRMRPVLGAQKAAPVTLSLDGIATAELAFRWPSEGTAALEEVISVPQQVLSTATPNPEVVGRVTTVRAAAYPPLDDPLLPAPGALMSTAMSEAQWQGLICEAVRASTEADSVFISTLPKLSAVPGPMTSLQLLHHLAILDTLQLHTVSGSSYSSLLDKAYAMDDLVSCGATASSKSPRGRSIDTARVYRVVTTDKTAFSHRIGPLLAGARPSRPLDRRSPRPVLGDDGSPATMQASVIQTLREIRDEGGGPEAITPWLAAAPSAMPPMWLLRVRQLNVQLTDFQGGENNSVFSEVPETLITSPSSFTLGSLSDIALEYSASAVAADVRLRTAFTTLNTEEAVEATETADDIRVSTSLSVPAWKLPVLKLVPYTEVLYDTELTPTTDEEGNINSRQEDLSLTLGVSSGSRGILTAARLGAFANRDMAQLAEKPTEFGGKLEWSTSKSFSTALTWTTLGDVQLYANTPDDDLSDLRLRALAESRLVLPLARYLNINLYVQGLALRGRVPATEEWGGSYTIGAALDLAGAFEL